VMKIARSLRRSGWNTSHRFPRGELKEKRSQTNEL
jgi:hypothetical protein